MFVSLLALLTCAGLDSASSLEILKSLQEMAGTGRAVVVTIHQPRSEIFHAFDKILLLCKGQVAFFGSPVKVWEFFRKALIMEKELEVHVCHYITAAIIKSWVGKRLEKFSVDCTHIYPD